MTFEKRHLFAGTSPQRLKEAFLREGLLLSDLGECAALSAELRGHIDLFCVRADSFIFYSEDSRKLIEGALREEESPLECVLIKERLKASYPFDVPLNVCFLKDFLIANSRTASGTLLDYAEQSGRRLIDLKQGYTNCSICRLSDKALITEDEGIFKACEGLLDVLLLKRGGISLKGLSCGFIGGASALIGDCVYFFGDLESHPEAEKIEAFIRQQGKSAVSLLKGERLFDIGGVMSFA